jgi:hypothetical protein
VALANQMVTQVRQRVSPTCSGRRNASNLNNAELVLKTEQH